MPTINGLTSPNRSPQLNDSFAGHQEAENGFGVADHAAERTPTASPVRRWRRALRHSRSRHRRPRSRSRRRQHPGLARKLWFLTHLLQTLDMVVIAEMSGLYYVECSLFRLAIRCIGHFLYLSPKDDTFPIFMPASIVHLLFIFVPNIICTVLHLFGPLPVAPDYNRDFQQGGIVIDFIGQQTPAHRIYYCLIDIIILLTQIVMLAVHTEREHLRAALKTFRTALPFIQEPTIASTEHLDAAERGETRPSQAIASQDPADMELQLMDRNDAAHLLPDDASGDSPPAVPLTDVMNSGTAIIGDYDILQSLLSASRGIERTAARSLQAISYAATDATIRARQRRAAARTR
ncbi:hypothetical protein CP532_5177 [Ophiocordyceps camponoti-leonardi (nom. inval.)]|nr:hypothetical protein CP532_5177 [Ophiocordyceps camponoti-leonardi (nom. inval.)]